MAVHIYRLTALSDNGFAGMSEADQAANTRGSDGWTVGKTAAGNSCEFKLGTQQAAASFTPETTTAKPTSLVNGSFGNAIKAPSILNGIFANSNWVFTFAVRALVASAQTGRIRMRVYKAKNQGATLSVVELTSAVQVGTTTAAITATADATSVVTWAPGAAIQFNAEYLFFAVAWEIVVASGSTTGDVHLRTGTSTTGTFITTPNVAQSLVVPHRRNSLAQMTRWYS